MTQKRPGADSSIKSAIPNPRTAGSIPTEFAEIGKKRVEAMLDGQKGLFDALQEMNRNWFVRAQSEANLTSELASKLTASRSVHDAASAYQQWMGRRMEMFAEDGRRFLANSQKLMKASAHLISDTG